MKDNSGAQVLGRTSLKRLGFVAVPTVIAAGALGVLMANGAIASSFAVSGQEFKLSASTIQGQGFVNYGSTVPEASNPAVPVAVSAFKSASINNLCQTVVTSLPVIGDVTLTIKANSASATDLIIDMQQLNADTATFNNLNIGQDASTLGGSATGATGTAGLFGQQADSATLDNVQQVANFTNAGTFTLSGMSMGLSSGDHPCF